MKPNRKDLERKKMLWHTVQKYLIKRRERAQYTEYDQLSTLREDSQQAGHPRFRTTSTQQSFSTFSFAGVGLHSVH